MPDFVIDFDTMSDAFAFRARQGILTDQQRIFGRIRFGDRVDSAHTLRYDIESHACGEDSNVSIRRCPYGHIIVFADDDMKGLIAR